MKRLSMASVCLAFAISLLSQAAVAAEKVLKMSTTKNGVNRPVPPDGSVLSMRSEAQVPATATSTEKHATPRKFPSSIFNRK